MSPQFYRLLWKEYRTQRSLWLALAGFMFALQATFYWMFRFNGVTAPSAAGAMGGMLIVIVACFMVASAAVAFAGEEDEGTAIWLRLFPASARSIFWSKILMTVISSLVMAVIGCVAVLLVVWTVPEPLPRVENVSTLIHFALVPTMIMAVSVFWSLYCRTVFSALGMIGATILVVGIWSASLSDSGLLVRWGVAAAFALLSIPMMYRWQRGTGFQRVSQEASTAGKVTSKLKGLDKRLILLTGLPLLAALSMFAFLRMIATGGGTSPVLQFFFVAGVSLVAAVWFLWPVTWEKWLTKSASASPQMNRTFRVLMWRECRLAIPFALASIAACVVAVLVRIVTSPVPWPLILLSLVSLEFGLRTFRHDQQNLHGLFWSHRGISPALVLAVRTTVWLALLFVVAVAFLILDSFDADANSIVNVTFGMLERLSPRLENRHLNQLANVPFDSFVRYGLTWLVGGFFISQLCAAWFRKPLIAFFMAACGVAIFHVGLLYSVGADIPLLLWAWPLIGLCIVAVFRSRHEWMDRRFDFRIGAKRVAFFIIPMLCLWPLHELWRMAQVPPRGPGLMTSAVIEGYAPKFQKNSWAANWNSLDEAIQPLHHQREAFEAPLQLDNERMRQAQQAISKLFKTYAHRKLPAKWKLPWAKYPAQPLAFAVVQHAKTAFDDGHAFKAMEELIKGIYLLRFLQQESTSWDQFHWSMQLEQHLLQHLHYFAADDRVTAKELNLASNDFAEFVASPIQTKSMLANRQAVYWHALRRSGYLEDFLPNDADQGPLFSASYAERTRFLSLLAWSDNITAEAGGPVAKHMQRWAATTVTVPSDLLEDPVFNDTLDEFSAGQFRDGKFSKQHTELRNAEYATWLILKAQAWRRKHGEFPDTTNELEWTMRNGFEGDDLNLLLSLQANAALRFRKSGSGHTLVTPGSVRQRTIIAADQPVLVSQQAMHFSASNIDNTPQFEDAPRTLTLNPNRIVYLDGSQAVAPAGGIDVATEKQ